MKKPLLILIALVLVTPGCQSLRTTREERAREEVQLAERVLEEKRKDDAERKETLRRFRIADEARKHYPFDELLLERCRTVEPILTLAGGIRIWANHREGSVLDGDVVIIWQESERIARAGQVEILADGTLKLSGLPRISGFKDGDFRPSVIDAASKETYMVVGSDPWTVQILGPSIIMGFFP